MELVRFAHKNLGETPLECLNRFRVENPEYRDLVGTYAGRLDPAAEGLMLFLFGDMVHKKDDYLVHDKTYTATFALGVSTDTGDLLGLPLKTQTKVSHEPNEIVAKVDEEKIKKLSKELEEKIKNITTQTYPAYSSKPVDGKPLFAYAREGNEVERPNRNVKIYSCDILETRTISSIDLLTRVGDVCSLVTGDFRQPEIIGAWSRITLPQTVLLTTLSLSVSSGTYIRSMCEEVESVFGAPAVLYSLVRMSIGNIKK